MGHGLIPNLTQDALSSQRQRFWNRFNELGLPKPKQEAFQYLPLRTLSYPTEQAAEKKHTLKEIEAHLLPDCSGRIVFVDGFFDPDLSALPEGCQLLPLDAAMKSYGLVLQNRFARTLKEETDPFACLNGAFHGRGAFLYIQPGVEIDTPIQVLSLFTSEQDWMAERLQIFLGKAAKASLIQTFVGKGTAVDLIDISLDAGAHLSITDSTHQIDPSAMLFRNIRAALKRDSFLSTFSYSEGAKVLRKSLQATLLEENSEVHFKGLDNLYGAQQAHTHILVEHKAPHCISRQHFKKALREESRSSFEGKIYVHPEAQKTAAYQLNQNLILSDAATANSKPNLEIFADDVKASHGATFSQLNEEEIFYFRARGISKKDAKTILFEGFCRELVDGIEEGTLKDALKVRLAR